MGYTHQWYEQNIFLLKTQRNRGVGEEGWKGSDKSPFQTRILGSYLSSLNTKRFQVHLTP